MKIFEQYAQYYDLLYRDKNYLSEADFIHQIIQQQFPGAKTICDLGCGTGNHAFPLADLGYQITGIDNSKDNIEIALEKCFSSGKNQSALKFKLADIRNIRLKRTFDVVISLFHVMSYQIAEEDLIAAFQTAKLHLNQGGLFIFDCWYGPAVLTDRPRVSVKQAEDEKVKIIRIAEPEMIPNRNLVEVNYRIFVQDKAVNQVKEIYETHRLRYLFYPEVEYLIKQTGLTPISCLEWLTDNPPGFDTWNVYFTAKIDA